MNKKTVTAVVVTYNRIELLKECLEALIKSEYDKERYNLKICAVDNKSTDGTSEYLDEFSTGKEYISVFHMPENGGGAGGFSKGMKEACVAGCDYIWLMDDDTIVNNDSLQNLLAAAELLNDDFGFLSSLALWTDGTPCKMNYHNVNKRWYDDKKLITEKMLRIDMATFVSFFIKADTVKELGLPFKEYFIWGDDTEYSARVSGECRSFLCGASTVTHKMKANKASDTFAAEDDEERVKRHYFSFRNDINTYRKFGFKYRLVAFAKFWITFAGLFFKRRVPFRGLKIRTMAKGGWDGMWFRPKKEFPGEE